MYHHHALLLLVVVAVAAAKDDQMHRRGDVAVVGFFWTPINQVLPTTWMHS